jgi:hypothetical protein
VVKIREQTLAEDHPDRLVSQHTLATMYWDLGRRKVALDMMKHVVEIHRQVLDKYHPARTGSEAWLKHFEREMGNMQPVESTANQKWALSMLINFLGSNHNILSTPHSVMYKFVYAALRIPKAEIMHW